MKRTHTISPVIRAPPNTDILKTVINSLDQYLGTRVGMRRLREQVQYVLPKVDHDNMYHKYMHTTGLLIIKLDDFKKLIIPFKT